MLERWTVVMMTLWGVNFKGQVLMAVRWEVQKFLFKVLSERPVTQPASREKETMKPAWKGRTGT